MREGRAASGAAAGATAGRGPRARTARGTCGVDLGWPRILHDEAAAGWAGAEKLLGGDKKELIDGVHSIGLSANAIDMRTAYLSLQYEFSNIDDCMEEQKARMNEGL